MNVIEPKQIYRQLSEDQVRRALEDSSPANPIAQEIARLIAGYTENFRESCETAGVVPESILHIKARWPIEAIAFELTTTAIKEELSAARGRPPVARTITPDLLSEVGEALFGRDWLTPMAEALDVSRRTIQRWRSHGAPESVRHELAAQLAYKISRARRVLNELDPSGSAMAEEVRARPDREG